MMLVDSDEESEVEDRSIEIVLNYKLASYIIEQYELCKD